MSWDPSLAEKANLPLAELRAYESIFHKLDPQSEGEINVTKCDAPVCFILLQHQLHSFFFRAATDDALHRRFVRSGLGRATTGLTLSSRDLRRLFSALRQVSLASCTV